LPRPRLVQRFAVTALDRFRHYGRSAAQEKPRKADGKQGAEADDQVTAGLGHAGIRELASFCKVASFGQAGL
jgi:hypothetical protein